MASTTALSPGTSRPRVLSQRTVSRTSRMGPSRVTTATLLPPPVFRAARPFSIQRLRKGAPQAAAETATSAAIKIQLLRAAISTLLFLETQVGGHVFGKPTADHLFLD